MSFGAKSTLGWDFSSVSIWFHLSTGDHMSVLIQHLKYINWALVISIQCSHNIIVDKRGQQAATEWPANASVSESKGGNLARDDLGLVLLTEEGPACLRACLLWLPVCVSDCKIGLF